MTKEQEVAYVSQKGYRTLNNICYDNEELTEKTIVKVKCFS